MSTMFPDVWAFYADRPERKLSCEVDYGVMWRDGFARWPHYRVSWVEATGEFYAVKMVSGAGATVELLGVRGGREAAEATLAGWAEIEPMDLVWVRARLA